jgi:23S rRNA-/tRNA-specific pseudouridylate synthase
LRLQLAFLGLPVLGDRLYAKDRGGNFSRTMLHAESLTISHPVFKKNITITADLFDDMKKLLNNNPNI